MDTPLFYSYLLELLIKSTLVLLGAAAIAAALQRSSAARRHAVWLAAFIALLILPLTKAIPPIWRFQETAGVRMEAITLGEPSSSALGKTEPLVGSPSSAAAGSGRMDAAQWLAIAWGLGAAAILVARIVASLQLALVKGRSVPAATPALVQIAGEIAEELRITPVPQLRASDAVQVACAAGCVNPFVLLPPGFRTWSEARLRATLRHEFAHIARRDSVSRWIGLLACALHWPNPLVWIATRRLQLEQEQACDDLAISTGTHPQEYATVLLDSARDAVSAGNELRASMAMARPATLEARVIAVMDSTRDRRPAEWRVRCVGAAGVLVASTGAALAQVAPMPQQTPPQTVALITETNGIEKVIPVANAAKPTNPVGVSGKATEFIIPQLELKNAKVVQAVDFLRRKAEPNGVVVKGEGLEALGERRITISLKQVSLLDALRRIAAEADLEVTEMGDTLLLRARPGVVPVPPSPEPPSDGVFPAPNAAPAVPGIPGLGAPQNLPIDISADKTRFEAGVAVADGNVRFAHNGIVITAESLRYHPNGRFLELAGGVEITQGINAITGESLLVRLLPNGSLKIEGAHRTKIKDASPAVMPPR
jgi:beta-lactamase regulating signal transducer with metallopeptidase domain